MKVEYHDDVVAGQVEGHANGSFHPENITLKHIWIFVAIIGAILVYHFRNRIGAFHDRFRLNRRMRYANLNSDFQDDVERGLNSENFNITEDNQGDTRRGLGDEKVVIEKLMHDKNLTFDEARLEYQQMKFSDNGVGLDGVPTDPKTARLN